MGQTVRRDMRQRFPRFMEMYRVPDYLFISQPLAGDFAMVIHDLLHDVDRPVFDFLKNLRQVFGDDAETEQLHRPQKQDDRGAVS